MTDQPTEYHGTRILECAPTGAPVATDRDAVELIAQALSTKARLIVLPTNRLPAGFFTLSTRIAGEIIQKFVQYRMKLVIIGDITSHLATSSALRAFVHEANRGNEFWFVKNKAELDARLSAEQKPTAPPTIPS